MKSGSISDRQERLLQRLAQACAAALALGTALQLFRGGALSAYLHMHWVLAPAVLKAADTGMGLLLLVLAVLGFFKRFSWAWLGLSLLLLLQTFSSFYTAGKWHAHWHLLAGLCRAFYPALLFWWGRKKVSGRAMVRSFRILLALVFASHGILAALQTPDFIDYVLGSLYQLSGSYADEAWVRYGLYIVALLDLATAVLLLWRLQTRVLRWAVFWILLTLCMRLLTAGWLNYTELLVRLPYLYMAWFLRYRQRMLSRGDTGLILR